MLKRMICAAALAGAAVAASPASAAEDFREPLAGGQQRAAFAGATVRVGLGRHAAPAPEARLGIGLIRYRRGGSGALSRGGAPLLPVAAGFAGGRLEMFTGGGRLAGVERRLGVSRSATPII